MLIARVTQCDLSDRFFCIHTRLLCKFQRDKIWVNKFQLNRSRQIPSCNPSLSQNLSKSMAHLDVGQVDLRELKNFDVFSLFDDFVFNKFKFTDQPGDPKKYSSLTNHQLTAFVLLFKYF